MKRILGILVLTVFSLVSIGENVDRTKATIVATNWYRNYAPKSKNQAVVAKTIPYQYKGRECFYIFSFNEGGFVLVSANDAVTPVLGYGFDYPIPDSITNEAVIGWFDGYARQIDTAFVIKLDNAAASEKWNQILKNTFPKSPGDGVGPLLTTIWDQGCYYNDSCPEGLGGPCNHAWTGCVATAMAQIMKYHDFPQQGYGENAYVSNNYGTISVNFFNSYYNWNAMTDMATSSNPEIAKLMFDCGVSLNMDYSPYSSGAYTQDIRNSLVNYFTYSPGASVVWKSQYSNDWDELIRSELDSLRPVIHRGVGGAGGHAWVCDGYQDNSYFHLNFGWSGAYNGYYILDNINPGGYNFTLDQMVIIDIRPSTDPPEAKFNANIVIALPGTSVTFKDNTKGLPTSWNWQFPGATPDNSNSQHPSGIVYNTPGFYDVCLIAANSYGSDTMNQKTYIYIVDTSNNFITGTMPLKNSIGVERDSNIRIQFKQAMEPSSFSNTSIRIFGDLRGSYSFQSTYNSATNTLVINPDNLFMTGENIVIVLTEKIHTSQNDSIVPYSFTFQVTSGHGTGIFKQVAYFPISCNEWPGSLKCGDYDNDGDIDIATSRGDLLLNDGSGNFSITSHGLWGYAIANGDFDMNHMVDIFNGSTIALNEGGGLFAYQGVGTWGTNLNTSDLNNDGLMDIIGSLPWPYVQNGSVLTTKRNIGNVNFIEYSSHTTSDIINSTALGDIDNDGDFDICAAGGSVFINTLDTLNMMTSLKFSGSIIKSGDFNNDGNVDFVTNGGDVYLNSRYGTFIKSNQNITGNDIETKDFNYDGKLDLFITSGVNSVPIMKNAGNGVFTRISNPIVGRNPDNLPQTIAITSGDFNNDGNIDLAVTTVNPLAISILYQINDSVTPPDLLYPPDGIVGLSLNPILRWNDSSGSAINYRLQVSLDSLFASFVIDTTVTINQWQFNGILHNDTTYYWRVNETNYLKESEFSTTFKFTIDMPFEVTGVDLGSWFASSAEWGDFDNDGDLDLLCTGGSNNSVPFNFKSRIFRNDGNGQFVNINSGIVPVGFGNATWGDYDNDGDLDVLVVGPTNEWPYYIGVAKIYKNNGNGNFIDINAAIQPPGCCTGIWEGLNQQGDTECSGVWADLDNDGDLDVIISGIMYENLGNDQFIRVENGIHSIGLGSIDLGDYDRDNDLDLLVCGRVTFNDMQTIVYRNDGHFNFTQMNFDLVGIEFGSARWGDYNNDGFLDILVNGNRGGNIQNEIYQNINGNDFVQIASGLPDICLSSGIWGDYNSDGLLDIAISGWNGIEVFTRVYKNSGMNNFTNIEGGFWGTAWNSGENMAWGDYDNDGDIDLIVTGSNLNNTGFNNSILYRNLMDTPNTPPSVPTNLNSQVLCNSVILNWDKSTDQTTPQSGISYNILLGTTPGGGQIVSSNSEYPGGFRKVANFGNTGHNSSWRIDSLSPGTYYWCVQAIDNSFGGSPFSVVDSFTVIGFPIPEPAGQISGLTTVCFGQTDVIYSIQEIANATGYVWNVPAGVTITAGYNTNSITVNFTNTAVSGKFTVYGTIGCVNSIVSPDFMVTVSSGFTCGSSIIINHVADTVAPVTKTVTYSIVNNIPGEPSKCWITSNLGADHQATSVDDATEESAGWYWQFNRKQGYKHDGINRTPNNAWVNPIIEDFDWQAANDPCTHEIGGGWRVPTYSEFDNVFTSGGWTDWNGPWNSSLKLHAAGYLTLGNLVQRGVSGDYWSSTSAWFNDQIGRILLFYCSSIYINTINKETGNTLRCLREAGSSSPSTPTVTTTSVSNIGQNTVSIGANVTSNCGDNVTNRGVCWSTSSNPTTADNHTTDGGGTGEFVSNITGLTANSLFYVRSYAVNVAGTAYGNQATFSTLAGLNINGTFRYHNTANTVMDSLWVILKQNGIKADSVQTNISGQYAFTGKNSATYTIGANCTKPWGGVNATDAIKVERHFVGMEPFTIPVRLLAGDVNNSNFINATDATKIKRRFVGLENSFARNDWTFAKPTGGDTVILSAANVVQDFQGLCVGDVNGSYIPAPGDWISRRVEIANPGTIEVSPGQIFELPVKVTSDMLIGALSLVIHYPPDLLDAIDISMTQGSPLFNIANDEIRIAWSEIEPLNLKTGETMLTLRLRAKESFTGDQTIELHPSNESELADDMGKPIQLAELSTLIIKPLKPNGTREQTGAVNSFRVYPNPAQDVVFVEADLESNAECGLQMVDGIGRTVKIIAVTRCEKGAIRLKINTADLPNGIYSLKISFDAESGQKQILYKVVIKR